MRVQIYAFTDPDEALRAVEAGVDHVGFVAGRHGEVHGELDFGAARRIRDAVAGRALASALTMATGVEEILRMAGRVEPDLVHVSTDLEAVGPRKLEALRSGLPDGIRLMKALPVEGPESAETAARLAPLCDLLLLDTATPELPGVGATGRTHDWEVSRRIVESVDVPVILAGGLTPENVGRAIRTVRPRGVDSNTGTNVPGEPVEKDLGRIRAFVEAARAPAASAAGNGTAEPDGADDGVSGPGGRGERG